ncbi:MAG: isocitrate lyase/phosphoenolpyruvate mutase family protein, partial [Acidimicrobiales bacterium]
LVDRLLEIGAVGCNLEDTDHRNGGLVDAGAHAERLAAIQAAAHDAGVPIVINARVDTFLPPSGVPVADRVAEAIRRGRRYLGAGADCVYPIGVGEVSDVASLVAELPGPVNANPGGAGLDLATLRELGVARVSYGPRFYRQALANFTTAVHELVV